MLQNNLYNCCKGIKWDVLHIIAVVYKAFTNWNAIKIKLSLIWTDKTRIFSRTKLEFQTTIKLIKIMEWFTYRKQAPFFSSSLFIILALCSLFIRTRGNFPRDFICEHKSPKFSSKQLFALSPFPWALMCCCNVYTFGIPILLFTHEQIAFPRKYVEPLRSTTEKSSLYSNELEISNSSHLNGWIYGDKVSILIKDEWTYKNFLVKYNMRVVFKQISEKRKYIARGKRQFICLK